VAEEVALPDTQAMAAMAALEVTGLRQRLVVAVEVVAEAQQAGMSTVVAGAVLGY
jgi:hypothetical protein